MSTNFYWPHEEEAGRMDPSIHLGKRSAAGLYCWDCGLTLCKGGEARIHFDDEWYDACPRCGGKPVDKTLTSGAVGVELGFAKAPTAKPTGVRSCCSFGWAQDPDEVKRRCEVDLDTPIIVDEYGREYTGRQFLDVLVFCPVQRLSLGQWFC